MVSFPEMYNDFNFLYKLRVGRVEAGQVAPDPPRNRDLASREGELNSYATDNKEIKKHVYGKQQTPLCSTR